MPLFPSNLPAVGLPLAGGDESSLAVRALGSHDSVQEPLGGLLRGTEGLEAEPGRNVRHHNAYVDLPSAPWWPERRCGVLRLPPALPAT